MQRIKTRHLKIGVHCLLILLGLLCIFRFVKVKYIDESIHTFSGKDILPEGVEKGTYTFTDETQEVSQTFQVATDILWGIELNFQGRWEDTQGAVRIVVEDDNGDEALDQTVPLAILSEDEPLRMIFDHIEYETKGREFTIRISPENLEIHDVVQLVTLEESNGQDVLQDHTGVQKGCLKIRQIDGQNQSLNRLFWLIAVGTAILIYTLYFFVFIKKSRLEFIFLFVMLTAGMMMVFLLKPGSIPDESAHYRSAYAWSNVLLGETQEVYEPVKVRNEDHRIHDTMRSTELTIDVYRDLREQFLQPASDDSKSTLEKYPTKSPWFLYLGQITGITLGRIAGFNGLTVFYLGRIFGLLLFVGMAFYAICKMPFYKMSIFAICLLPMSVQMAAGYSYDSTILGLALMAVTSIFSLGFTEQKKHQKIGWIKLAVICILLGTCKGGAYLPICGLLLLIPKERYPSKKIRWIFLSATLLGVIVCYFLSNAGTVSSSVGVSTHTVAWADEPGYTITWVLKNPGDFIQLITNTIFQDGEQYINSLIGKDLGWFDVPVKMTIIYGFMAVFLMTCVRAADEKTAVLLEKRQRLGTAVCIVISIAIIAAAMLLSWTPQSSQTIQGIQGRYFLPLLFPLVLCLKNKTLILRKNLDRVLVFSIAWLLVLTMVCILVVPLGQLIQS